MTDPELTPVEAEVRRLLVEARHDEPMPDEVVARLDRVLDGLASEPARSGAVVHLAARRRRVAQLLVAAAAVVAVGVGVGQVLDGFNGGAGDAADSAAEGSGLQAEKGDEPGAGPEFDAGAEAETPTDGSADRDARLPKVRPDALASDVASLSDSLDAYAYSELRSSETAAGVVCRSQAWGSGTFVPVRYGSARAVLVLRKAQGDTRVADIFLCGSAAPIRSVTLPAP
jgi:hypothetical protein